MQGNGEYACMDKKPVPSNTNDVICHTLLHPLGTSNLKLTPAIAELSSPSVKGVC